MAEGENSLNEAFVEQGCRDRPYSRLLPELARDDVWDELVLAAWMH